MVSRGGCEFLTKALFAQTAGYAGLIVLDTKINTEFKRIVYGNNRRAFFVRIPVVFVLKPDADVISKLPHGSYPVTLQNERPVKFRPMWTKNSLENNGAASRNSTTKSLPEKIKEQFKSLSFLSWITLGNNILILYYLSYIQLENICLRQDLLTYILLGWTVCYMCYLFKCDRKETKILHLLFHRIWKIIFSTFFQDVAFWQF